MQQEMLQVRFVGATAGVVRCYLGHNDGYCVPHSVPCKEEVLPLPPPSHHPHFIAVGSHHDMTAMIASLLPCRSLLCLALLRAT